MSEWLFRWPLPLWVMAMLAITAVGLAWGTYRWHSTRSWRRTLPLWLLRGFVLLVVLAMLGGPVQRRYRLQHADLIVLVDDSASMQAASPVAPASDAAESSVERSRYERALQILRTDDRLQTWREHYSLQLRALSGAGASADELAAVAEYPHSPIGSVLSQLVTAQRGRRTAAVVLLSDGIVTAGPSLSDAAQAAAAEGIPVVAVALGSDARQLDARVEDVLFDRWALVGDRVELRALVRVEGLQQPRRVQVDLVDQASGEVVDSKAVTAPAGGGAVPVTLATVADAPRIAELTVRVETLRNEAGDPESDVDNNRRTVAIQYRDEPLKVLLVQDRPSYEFRYLKHLLERVRGQQGERPLVELTAVLQSGDPEYARQDETATLLPPVGSETLATFDAVVLSDAAVGLLGDVFLTQLAGAVRDRGVGLVVVAGPWHLPGELRGTPLEPLLPARLAAPAADPFLADPVPLRRTPLGRQDVSLRLGEDAGGQNSPQPLPHLTAVWPVGALQPQARSLLETDTTPPRPVVVTQLAGAGQVRLQLTDEMYRLQPFDGSGRMYERYWLQALRELARGKRRAAEQVWELAAEGEAFTVGQTIPLRARVPGNPGAVEVEVSGDGVVRNIDLPRSRDGDYRGALDGLAEGRYRAVLVSPLDAEQMPPTATWRVTSPPGEEDRLHSDHGAMQQLANRTGGTFLHGDEELGDRLEAALPRLEPTKVMPLPPRPLWNHPLVALALFTALVAEWLLRRRQGMV